MSESKGRYLIKPTTMKKYLTMIPWVTDNGEPDVDPMVILAKDDGEAEQLAERLFEAQHPEKRRGMSSAVLIESFPEWETWTEQDVLDEEEAWESAARHMETEETT